MTPETFSAMLLEIYPCFGRQTPAGDVRAVIERKLRDVPDEAWRYMADQICSRDDLPRNMAKALLDAWGAWKSANPDRIVREYCPHCRDKAVFHCWAWDERKACWHTFAIPCPYCQAQGGGRIHPSPAELGARKTQDGRPAALVMPPDYPGGPVAFDRDKRLGCLWPAGLDTGTPRPQMRVGVDMQQDARRLRHLPAAERQDAAPAENW
ncbi:MAG: hypothetical protein SPI23_01240 [Desulfovibrio sp.]|uniref:hypothetical protein n=1 Tax=Desulfovibrio sp. TaxID=885 RepID=UPI002A9145AF|nr:hypothetical protein [Desulfovibrio sp.]MDY6233288.1 hypothetical protein [Desulfovibrio sp.]